MTTLNWHDVARADQVTADAPFPCAVGDVRIALYRTDEGISAIGDVCTHEDVLLSGGWLENCIIECPMHQAMFDVRTGKCTGGPTDKDVPLYAVKEEDGVIFVGITAG